MSYENAPATRFLATNCCICGKPLVDAASVECGIGPDCRAKLNLDPGIADEVRKIANDLTYRAAIAATEGRIEEVRKISIELEAIGLIYLAEKVAKRFVGAEKKVKVTIVAEGDYLRVTTPYRRGDAEAFKDAWRAIPGRKWFDGANLIPMAQGQALYALLKQFFPGDYATGPKGLFRIPRDEARNS